VPRFNLLNLNTVQHLIAFPRSPFMLNSHGACKAEVFLKSPAEEWKLYEEMIPIEPKKVFPLCFNLRQISDVRKFFELVKISFLWIIILCWGRSILEKKKIELGHEIFMCNKQKQKTKPASRVISCLLCVSHNRFLWITLKQLHFQLIFFDLFTFANMLVGTLTLARPVTGAGVWN
jgi:hypothetical protein